MRYSTQMKPITAISKPMRPRSCRSSLQIASHSSSPRYGEAKAAIEDVSPYEETQETPALLKILALGSQQVAAGRVRPLAEAVRRVRGKKTGEPPRS